MLFLPKEVKAWLDAALIEGNFSGYELLAEALKERGCAISKSSLQRYGEPFQVMMSKVKIAGEQAAALMAEAGDDKGAMNDALIRMIQQKTFEVLMSERIDQPGEGEEAVASIATDPKFVRAIATLVRASVTQKEWANDFQKKAEEKFRAFESQQEGQVDKLELLRRVREEIYGLVK